MVARGGSERAKKAAEDCAQLLKRSPLPEMEEIARLDLEFIRDDLSPGGCADLLAAAFFLLGLEMELQIPHCIRAEISAQDLLFWEKT